MRVRIAIPVALLMVTLGYLASPCLTLWHLATALEHGDVAVLERGVDWQSLRAGLKDDIAEGVIGPVSTQLASNTLPPFGASFITGIADAAVEHEVTASNVVAMMRHMPLDDTVPSTVSMVEHVYFESPTRFVVTFRGNDDDGHLRLRLEFGGISWRVTRAWIPQDMIERVSQRT